jgi:hypothetical protein
MREKLFQAVQRRKPHRHTTGQLNPASFPKRLRRLSELRSSVKEPTCQPAPLTLHGSVQPAAIPISLFRRLFGTISALPPALRQAGKMRFARRTSTSAQSRFARAWVDESILTHLSNL